MIREQSEQGHGCIGLLLINPILVYLVHGTFIQVNNLLISKNRPTHVFPYHTHLSSPRRFIKTVIVLNFV